MATQSQIKGNNLTSSSEIIMSYQSLLEHSTKMLNSVRDEDWDTLIEAEVEYVREVEKLSHTEACVELSEDEQVNKFQLLNTIMDNEREIRERLIARRSVLQNRLLSMRKKQQLERSYHS